MGDTNDEQLILELQQKEKGYILRTKQTDDVWQNKLAGLFQPLEPMYKQWCEELRIRLEKKDRTLQITSKDQISTHISRELREAGCSEGSISWMRKSIDSEYKDKRFINTSIDLGDGLVGDLKIASEGADNDEDDILDADKIVMPKLKSGEKLSHEDAVKAKKLAKKIAEIHRTTQDYVRDVVEPKAEEKGWVDVKKRDPIETVKGDPRETESWSAAGKHAQRWLNIQKNLYEYPPTDEEDKIISKGILDWDKVFEYSDDDKYTQSFVDWTEMLDYYYNHGKNAAGKQWATDKPMLLYNKETNSYEVIPIEKRKYTREQVGDQNEVVEAQRENLWKAIPVISAIARWTRLFQEPNRSDRKKRLGPILSELRFGGGGNLEDD